MDVTTVARHSRTSLLRLRRAVLASQVLDNVDLTIENWGVRLLGGAALTWDDIEVAVGSWACDPGHPVTRARLAGLFHAADLVAGGGKVALAKALRVHVQPVGRPLHPGPDWTVERVGSGLLQAGWGITGVSGSRHTRPLPPAPSLREMLRTTVAGGASWARHRAAVDRLGAIAVQRLDRDRRAGKALVLRPVGDADVTTLLMSPTLRRWLADLDGTGLAALAVPTRTRGWSDVRRVDPAFVMAAWAATDECHRGFAQPLLVTADDAVLPSRVGDVLAAALDDVLTHRAPSRIGRG